MEMVDTMQIDMMDYGTMTKGLVFHILPLILHLQYCIFNLQRPCELH